ncbi:endolytic transglycosylase MltG [Salipaludibacillus sp. CUR1]|uniref:endolytic transglycosylase MltG n=1 Tax=Salipaludibacillus sp. CUR1 TaxID=2820003 RepID=UPI001E32BEA5|nr:endolytic transglycosylase MltG [Salipaludibacillus sp. CUR1]
MAEDTTNDSNKNLNEKHKTKLEETKREAGLVRKIVLIFVITIIVAVVAGGLGAYFYVKGAIGPVDEEDDEVVEVTIPIGSNPSSIGEILEEEGVVSSASMFRYYVRFQNASGFQAGDYQLTRAMSMDEIIDHLKEGRVYEDYATSFTVPEGRWAEDIFVRVADETNLKAEELAEIARDEEYLEELIERYKFLEEDIFGEDIREPLEGYLFPARYDFVEEEVSAEQVIEAMLDRTNSILESRQASASDDSYHALMTKASIIEGEARTDEERATISGVIENRLSASMPLQMDPTIAYAHEEHLSRTLNAHLDIESPYNTYKNAGLPPGPINNPGEASIAAALEPESHEYIYFYHSPDGEVHFNVNYSDHEEVVEHYQNSNE